MARFAQVTVYLQSHFIFSILSVTLYGCQPVELPGELVGRYRVIGNLQSNSCGVEALPTVDPMVFEVEIREEDGAAIWAVPDKPFLSGTCSSDGEFRFRLERKVSMARHWEDPDMEELLYDPEKAMEPKVCILHQVEVIKGTVIGSRNAYHNDAGKNPKEGFEGEDIVDITTTDSSACSSATVASGGLFEKIPCQADYVLRGEPLDE